MARTRPEGPFPGQKKPGPEYPTRPVSTVHERGIFLYTSQARRQMRERDIKMKHTLQVTFKKKMPYGSLGRKTTQRNLYKLLHI